MTFFSEVKFKFNIKSMNKFKLLLKTCNTYEIFLSYCSDVCTENIFYTV